MMESIKIESGKKRLCLNDDESRVIEFNPQDMKTRKRFYEASQKIFEQQRELDIKIKQLKEDDIEGIFGFEQEAFDMMKNLVDEVFGEGTAEMVTEGDTDTIALCNFMTAITPYIRDVAEKQKSKYTNNLKSAGII